MQLKNAMMKCDGLRRCELPYTLKLTQSAPNSMISQEFSRRVASNENVDDVLRIATKKLFLKYIDPSRARLEVNICSVTRSQLMNVFKSTSTDSLGRIMSLLEQAVVEISQLMMDSFYRFRRDEVFPQLVNQ